MLSINTNLSSLIAQRSMKTSTLLLNQAIERMSTGFKVNHAKDNAAAYSIITNMDTKIGAYQVAEDNCAMGLDMLTTATDSLDLIYDKLTRLRDLAEQASNGTYGEQSLKAINSEANALVDEIERIYNNTEYNGINLMKGRVVGTEESKFIKDIDRRDTSKMITLASVKIDEALTSGTYSISTADELAKLATMTNNGLIGAGCEFVLANDIDLNSYANWISIGCEYKDLSGNYYGNLFTASFDGNGYEISNLKINTSEDIRSLFGTVCRGASVKNLGLVDISVNGTGYVGGIVGSLQSGALLSNCYVAGEVNGTGKNVGGLCGVANNSTIEDCYTDVKVKGISFVAGFVAVCANSYLNNCNSKGEVTVTSNGTIGGFIATLTTGKSTVNKCVSNTIVNNSTWASGTFVGYMSDRTLSSFLTNCYSTEYVASNPSSKFIGYKDVDYDPLKESLVLSNSDSLPFVILKEALINSLDSSLSLQIGSNSGESSRINVDTGCSIASVIALRGIGAGTWSYISQCDHILNNLSSIQSEFGAVQNRLESALDEISTQYENLVSSRSTLRDADIAEVSTQYIQQQILQQAASTLLSTANQSPSIALQLI